MWRLLRRQRPESDERAGLLEYYVNHQSAIEHSRNSLHIFVLDYIREYGPLTLDQLVSDVGLPATTLHDVLGRLDETHFVSSQSQTGQWVISAEGKDWLNRVLEETQDGGGDSPRMLTTHHGAADMLRNRRRFTWFDSVILVYARGLGLFFLSVCGIALSFVIYRTQERNAELDVAQRQRVLELQTKAEAARLAVSIVPMLSCGDDLKRASVFGILQGFPPAAEQASIIAQVLSAKCPNLAPDARSEIAAYESHASEAQLEFKFQRALKDAEAYQAGGFDRPAARLFYDAMKHLPASAAKAVDHEELARAKTAYENGRFSEAADRFRIAFRRIP